MLSASWNNLFPASLLNGVNDPNRELSSTRFTVPGAITLNVKHACSSPATAERLTHRVGCGAQVKQHGGIRDTSLTDARYNVFNRRFFRNVLQILMLCYLRNAAMQ